jgi:hypothetical protein
MLQLCPHASLLSLSHRGSDAAAVPSRLSPLPLPQGLGCCSYALTHARGLLLLVDDSSERVSFLLLSAIRWIMGVPAGLKLNDHLDFCLGNLCILGDKISIRSPSDLHQISIRSLEDR